MDLLHFEGEPMYFDDPLNPEVERLLAHAAEHYGDSIAEHSLMRAYFLAPHHLSVLVALYRYFYFRQRYREALVTADRAIAGVATRLNLPARWQDLSESHLGGAVLASMSLTRFLLLALKGAGYLSLRLGEPAAALERFDKIVEIDTSDRLGIKELRALAQRAVTEAEVSKVGGNLHFIGQH